MKELWEGIGISIVFFTMFILPFILFAGEPDLIDALIKRIGGF